MDIPLNINLILPFKDNRDKALRTFLVEITEIEEQITHRVTDIQSYLNSRFGAKNCFELKIKITRNIKKICWREIYKGNYRDYYRLTDRAIEERLKADFTYNEILEFVFIEEELLGLNMNLKAMSSIRSGINEFSDARANLDNYDCKTKNRDIE